MNLYRTLLGNQFDALPAQVRAFHDPDGVTVWKGRARVRRGAWMARLVCMLFRFPPEGDVPLSLTITPLEDGERWDRNFGGRVMSTVQFARDGWLIEHLGPVRIHMRPVIDGNRFSVRPERWCLLGVPLPKVLMPTSENAETDEDGTFHFDVSISAPLIGSIVSYRGYLEVCHV